MSKFHLVLLIHSHQPVGNFDGVIEETYQHSYLPFVQALLRHPNVRVGLHYTGPLLEWCQERHPEFFDHLRELVKRNQVEMVGGAFYEPILISIPVEDQIEQIRLMHDYLDEHFGRPPAGSWLAERVWEPQLPYALSAAGVGYTLVDDVHFLAAGFDLDQLHGDYVCDDRGRTVRVFPGLKSLRYLLPFRPPEDAIGFLRESAAKHPGGMAAMGDDCEKFGAWPGTFDHCYRDGWVDHFFSALEGASDWLVTTPPGDYARTNLPLGRADLPTASYSEMMEWALPTKARREFHAAMVEAEQKPKVARFLRGGTWRGFFTKYPESNLLQKKMLYVSQLCQDASAKRSSTPKRAKQQDAQRHILRAQCNDAYWHGVFGGLYAPHLRTELWRELIRAESLLEASPANGREGGWRINRLDFDADGSEELYITSKRMAALLRPSDGGTLAALDFRPSAVTLINSIQRRPETYHSRLREAKSHSHAGQVASIHDQVRCKEEGLEKYLRYDRWQRNSFRVLSFPADKTLEDYLELRLDEEAGVASGAYAVRSAEPNAISLEYEAPVAASGKKGDGAGHSVVCTKRFLFASEGTGFGVRFQAGLRSENSNGRGAQVGVELIVNLLAPNEPDRYFETPGGRFPLIWAGVVSPDDSGVPRLRAVDEWQNVAIAIEAPGASKMWVAPIETVSESEGGFERVYQGSQILVVYPQPGAGAAWNGEINLQVKAAREEAGRS